MKCVPLSLARFFLVTISGIIYALVYYHRVWPSILYSELALAFDVPETRIAVFSSMYFWPYALMQPVAGTLADIIEPAYLMSVATFVAAVGSLIISFSHSFALSCFARVLIGFGCAPIIVPICRILANWFSPRGFYIIQGVVHMLGAVGGLLAQGPLAAVLHHVDWRDTFMIVAVIGFVAGVLTMLFVRGDPRAAGYEFSSLNSCSYEVSGDELWLSEEGEDEDEVMGCANRHWDQLVKNARRALGNRYFWTLTLTNSFVPGTFYSFIGMWGGPYLEDVFGYSKTEVGNILMSLNVAYIIGTPTLSFLSEAIRSRKKVLCATSVCAFVVSMGFLFMRGDASRSVVVFMVFMFGLFTSGSTSTIITMIKELDSVSVSGTMIGFSNFFPFLATTVLQFIGSCIIEYVDGGRDVNLPHTFEAFRLAIWVPAVLAVAIGCVGIFLSRDTYK